MTGLFVYMSCTEMYYIWFRFNNQTRVLAGISIYNIVIAHMPVLWGPCVPSFATAGCLRGSAAAERLRLRRLILSQRLGFRTRCSCYHELWITTPGLISLLPVQSKKRKFGGTQAMYPFHTNCLTEVATLSRNCVFN